MSTILLLLMHNTYSFTYITYSLRGRRAMMAGDAVLEYWKTSGSSGGGGGSKGS